MEMSFAMSKSGTKVTALLIVLVIVFAALAGAGWLRPPETMTTTVTSTVTAGAGQTVTVTAGPVQKTSLTIRAVFQTPVSEPWDGAIHVAILAVVEEYQAKGITIDYKFVDRKVDPKEYELALRDAAQVADIVFLDAFLKEDIARRVAKDFPKVAFAAGSEYLPVQPNFAVFDNWLHQPAFLAGIIAGKITNTNKIGVVAAMDIGEVNRIVNAFILGAKTSNSKAQVKVSYLLGNIPPGESPWYHPATAKRLADVMIASGADVIFAERVGAEEAAMEARRAGKDVWVVGNMADQYDRAPDVTITSLVWDMKPTVRVVVDRVLSGTYTADNLGTYSWMSFGGSYLADFHAFGAPSPPLTQDIISTVNDWQQKIASGLTWVVINETPAKSDF